VQPLFIELARSTAKRAKERAFFDACCIDVFTQVGFKIVMTRHFMITKQGITPKNPDCMFLSFCKAAKKRQNQRSLF